MTRGKTCQRKQSRLDLKSVAFGTFDGSEDDVIWEAEHACQASYDDNFPYTSGEDEAPGSDQRAEEKLFINAETSRAEENQLDNHAILPIVEVFNTTEKLWLYQQNISSTSTRHGSRSLPVTMNETLCIFFMKYNITNDDIYFWKERKQITVNKWAVQRSEKGTRDRRNVHDMRCPKYEPIPTQVLSPKRKILLHGSFNTSHEPLGSMDVVRAVNVPRPYALMRLVYSDSNCSVFLTRYHRQVSRLECGVFVGEKQAPNGPTDGCNNYFKTNCTGDILVFYNKTCDTARSEFTSTQPPLKGR
ncbi:uncharacterized protein LOC119402198 isoform X2 [Rhipicephalus sanguineus]|uniref:uncharacterized protein LOC119402198 isoform X2 n=1 Tax=Rhipicephalus sanguineus TaxID=34632 RepID=UPI001895046E|nr:uncharacterized protein LOC119402198 isoform X2 [Rhipicephalus sanguineus]